MKNIYIINGASRALDYGIGTYTKQLICILKDVPIKINVVVLYSEGLNELLIEDVDGVRYFKVPAPQSYLLNLNNSNDRYSRKSNDRYLRNVYYLLFPYIKSDSKVFFHFNFMQVKELAMRIKNSIDCAIILTVHYMNWSFELFGDVDKLKKILENPLTSKDEIIKESFYIEKYFMHSCADYVIAIAKHSYDTITSLYQTPSSKVFLVPNGIEDNYTKLTIGERKQIKKRFNIDEREKLLIFAGRLDPIKGLSYLLKSFNLLLQIDNKVRLLIAGDGDYRRYINESSTYCTKVSYIGFIPRNELLQLFSIADLGIVPSIHEEFGYVAVEMMMSGLPIIVNNSTGLSEMITDSDNGASLCLNSATSIEVLSNLMYSILNNSSLKSKYICNGRETYLKKFNSSIFCYKMKKIYTQVLTDL